MSNRLPVTAREFAPSVCPEQAAVAVSGGADSMALLLLMREWAASHGIVLHALTIDHALRVESGAEAAQVGQWCRALGIAHHVLRWEHGLVDSGIQQQAREARYRLMLGWCRAQGINDLFTGHHQGDQVETFLLRLMRGSGPEGLAAILPVSLREGIALHRPLLSIAKPRLLATLEQHGQAWIEDPSNCDPRFTRTQLRTFIAGLDDTTTERISQLTIFFEKFRNKLECMVSEFIGSGFDFHPAGYGWLDAQLFIAQPAEIKTAAARYLCQMISGNGNPPRGEKIERLARALANPSHAAKRTLHGVVFHYRRKTGQWLAYREAKQIEAPRTLAERTLWDGRFMVEAMPQMQVGALGSHAAHFAKALLAAGIPKPVWPTLPAIFGLEECRSVPHIDGKAGVRFIHAKPLAASRDYVMNQGNNFTQSERARA